MLYDPVRLLVATTVPGTACRTPHLVADVLVALKTHVDANTVLVKASTYDRKLCATFTVHGKSFQVTQCDDAIEASHIETGLLVKPLLWHRDPLEQTLSAYAYHLAASEDWCSEVPSMGIRRVHLGLSPEWMSTSWRFRHAAKTQKCRRSCW